MMMAIDTLRLAQMQFSKIKYAGERSLHVKDRTIAHMARICLHLTGKAIEVWSNQH